MATLTTISIRTLAFCAFLSGFCVSHAQQFVVNAPPIGLPANGTFDGTDFDQVNMQSGNLHVAIPLVGRPERGRVRNTFAMVYDNQDWEVYEDCSTGQYCVPDTYPGPAMQWNLSQPGFRISMTPGICGTNGTVGTGSRVGPRGYNNSPYEWEYFSYDVIDENNTRHHMVPDTSDAYLAQVTDYIGGGIPVDKCAPLYYTNTLYAEDGSGVSYDPTNIGDMPDPRRFYQGPSDISGNDGIFDGNGNSSLAGGSIPAQFGLLPYTGGTYYDNAGNLQSISTTTISMLIDHEALGDGFDWEDCPSNDDCLSNWIQPPAFHGYITLISSLTLPNGQTYHFTYDPAFGDLTSVQLPTGGTISWTYEAADIGNYTNNGRAVRSRTVTSDPGATPQTWSYVGDEPPSYLGSVGTLGSYVLDPLNQKTSYTFDQYGNQLQKQVYDSSGTLRDAVTSTVGWPSICQNGTKCDFVQQRVLRTDHLLPDTGQVSSVTSDYDGIQLCWFDNSRCRNIVLQQVIDKAVYDFGAGAHGALLGEETTSYLHLPDSGIFDRPLSKTVTGPGNASSETWEYDNYGSVGLSATSGVPAHNYAQYSASYTARGNLTKHSVWDSSSSKWLSNTFTYDDLGNRLTSTDAKGNTTQFSYDDLPDAAQSFCTPPTNTHSYVTLITDPLGHRAQGSYNYCTGQIAEVWDENQLRASSHGTRYAYDLMKQQTQVTDALGGQTIWDYNGYANPFTVTVRKTANPDADIVSKTTRDGLGRTVQAVSNPNGPGTPSIVDTTYDALGRVHSVSYPYSATPAGGEIYTYDALNRKLNVNQPDGTNQSWTYSGTLTTFTDEAPNSWSRTSDALGRLTSVIEPGNLLTSYVYDTLGNLTSAVQTGAGVPEIPRSRSFSYNSLSRLLQSTNPETGTIRYNAYDGNGNLQSKTDANSVVTSYTYDTLNRLTMKSSLDQSVSDTYYYDSAPALWGGTPFSCTNGIGRLCQADHIGYAGMAFNYDPMGRTVSALYGIGNLGPPYMPGISASYDLAGGINLLTYPDGQQVSQSFDGAGRLARVASGGVTYIGGTNGGGIAYTGAGATQSFSLGQTSAFAGVSQLNLYNNRLQPCHTEVTTPVLPASAGGGGNLLDHQSFYSISGATNCGNETGNNGNIYWVLDSLNPNQNNQRFGYDNLNRLTTAYRFDNAYNHTYNYDSFGNMIVQDNLHYNPTYAIDPTTNELMMNPLGPGIHDGYGHQANTFIYDFAGNMVSSGANNMGGHQYTYNALSQVTGMDCANGSCAAQYTYNGNDERVVKTTSGGWTDYVYFNGQPMAELSSNGTWSDYIYANGQKIAKLDSAKPMLHLSGHREVNNYVCGTEGPITGTPGYPLGAVGYSIGPNDLLVVDFKQDQPSNGGVALIFTDNTGAGDLVDVQSSVPLWLNNVTGTWQHLSASLNNYVRRTIASGYAGIHQQTPTGDFNLWFENMAILTADGRTFPITTGAGQSVSGFSGNTCGGSNLASVTEPIPTTGPDTVAGTTYYLDDHLGTAQMELASGGWPLWQGQFTPFGAELPDGSTVMHYKFTGKERDTESGLDYFGARYYASNMGRFMSPDWADKPEAVPYSSLSDPQTLNLYGYMRNNPLGGTDKDGHCGQQQSGGTTCPTVTVTATPATQPAPVHTTTVTDTQGNQHTVTGPNADIHFTVSTNGTPAAGVKVTETNQSTTQAGTQTINGKPIEGSATSNASGGYKDTVGAGLPSSTTTPAAAASAYNSTPVTITDTQTQTLTLPGGCTCTATSTRVVTNTTDGKTISPGGYTLTTTQPVVSTPKPPQQPQ